MLDRTLLRHFVSAGAIALAALAPIGRSSAQDAPAMQAVSAQMRAARLTSSQGTVTVTDGNNPAAPAQMNLPLLQGVQIATGDDGQAEVEFEDGSIARLTPNSTLSLDRLDTAPGQIFVTDLSLLRGLAYFELRATPEYVYSVNAGGDVVSPVENATVRVDFDQPPASIAVLDGTAQVQRANAFKVDVVAGSTFRQGMDGSAPYSVTQQIAADSWDQWNADMDQQAAQQAGDSTSVRNDYAGAQGYGWSDLDNQGTWYDVPGQGQMWQPYGADSSDFDPYGNGAWVWYPGAGYLWASAYPWGWTPYRCGAWSYYDAFGWGWAPGASCGGFGWGFAGGGFVVNIVRWPRGYRPVRVPIARPGPARPVIPVRIAGGGARPWSGPAPNRGPRQIAGVTAKPIVPGHMSFAAGGGIALHRDFPIDRSTHAPAFGRVSMRSPNVYRIGAGNPQQGGQQQNGRTAQNGAAQPQQGQPQQNGWRGGQNGQPQNGPSQNGLRGQQNVPAQSNVQQPQPQQQGPRTRGLEPNNQPNVQPQSNGPGAQQQPQQQPLGGRPDFNRSQHTEPQRVDQNPRFNAPQQGAQNQSQPQRQIYTPQPQHTEPAHPQYTPQPQQPRQNFSPPQQPRYSPPPPQQPHFSPPPSPPSPPPHVSAPPPSNPAPLGHR